MILLVGMMMTKKSRLDRRREALLVLRYILSHTVDVDLVLTPCIFVFRENLNHHQVAQVTTFLPILILIQIQYPDNLCHPR